MTYEELFASCYTDECIGEIFVDTLRKNGFVVRTAKELDLIGARDEKQLLTAIDLKSILITVDKSTFIKDSKSYSREHYGIIIITRQISATFSRVTALNVIKKFLIDTQKTNGKILL